MTMYKQGDKGYKPGDLLSMTNEELEALKKSPFEVHDPVADALNALAANVAALALALDAYVQQRKQESADGQ